MPGFYRAIETEEGTWSCRRDLTPLDEHPSLNLALAHLAKLAEEEPVVAYVYAHWRDGRVELMGEHGGR